MNYSLLICIFFIAILGFACQSHSNLEEAPIDNGGIEVVPTHMLVGSYTRDEGWVNGTGEGIYIIDINENGSLSIDDTAAGIINPSFLALSPDQKNLYAVSELGRSNEPTGFLHAFSIESDRSLTFIDKYPTNAKSPAHVSVDKTGTFVFAANYQGGVVMVYERNNDGSLSVLQQLDFPGSNPHTHMAKVSPGNNFLYIPDLGNDKIWSFSISHEAKTLTKTEQEFARTTTGAGPRHMDFHPSLDVAYAINELNSTISVFDFDSESGALTEKQVISTLPESFTGGNSTADIHVHPNGNFLYGSNRGHNSIVSYAIDGSSGEISMLNHTSTEGEIPRNFAISPVGNILYVANQNSRNITSFDLNEETGVLSFTGNTLSVGTPVCIVFYEEYLVNN